MNDPDPDRTLPMDHPLISSSVGNLPQDTLLQRGAFDPPATPGTLGRLDRFEILRLLGEGGMGQVYLAREPLTDTQVAIKVMKPQSADDPREVHRFLTEARHMYRLAHPRILRVLEVSDRPAGPYYVMPYIAGGSLLGRCKPEAPMPEAEVLAIARQVAEALAHAHAHGLIHRDLKPGNVLLDKEGNAYLTDFGLVRTLFNDSMVDATASHLEGTAPYMSPAVARGEAEDTRCDIYAFGALLYELLTGKPPYTGRTPQIILDQVLKGPPVPLREVNPKASLALVKIAEGCMARELRDRYASMGDVVADLEHVAPGAAPLGTHQRQRRSPLRLAAEILATLAVAVLAGVALRHFSSAARTVPSTPVPGAPSPASDVPGRTAVEPKTQPVSTPVLAGTGEGDPTQVENGGTPTAILAAAPTASVQTELREGPFSYAINNGAVTITKYNGTASDVTIPDQLGGLPVRVLGPQLFLGVGLTSITLPESVTTIGAYAFHNRRELTAITLPGSVTTIGVYAFSSCRNLSSIILTGVTTIGEFAFNGCIGLSAISIPDSVTSIGPQAFALCSGLTAVNVDAANASYSSVDGVLFNKAHTKLLCYPGGKVGSTYTIPADVDIANPSMAFSGSAGLAAINVDTANPFYSSLDGVLFDKQRQTLLRCPGGKAGSYTIPAGVTAVHDNAFFFCTRLTTITIPDSVTSIGVAAFAHCTGLTSMAIPNRVTDIGAAAFVCCTSLTAVTIPASVISIGYGAFACGNGLAAVYFEGNAPAGGSDGAAIFMGANNATVYYRPGTKG